MKKSFTLIVILVLPLIGSSQTPVDMSYYLPSSVSIYGLNSRWFDNAPKECVIDFNSSVPSARVMMESRDGQSNYVDRTLLLEAQALPDKTFVHDTPVVWAIGL